MIRLLIAVAAMLSLAGCQTSAKFDTAVAKNLPQICNGSAQLHSAFLVIAASGKIKDAAVNKERAAWNALQVVCRDPGSVNSSTALVTAAEAYAAFVATLKH
jgi:hypothetical protein